MRLELKMPDKIIFGEGCVQELDKYAAECGDNIFIAASRSLLAKGRLDGILSGLKQRGIKYTVFDGVNGEPSPEMVDYAAEKARAAGCNAVIGIGGGSVLDMAKCVSALVNNCGGVEEYLELTDSPRALEGPVLPFVAVPTTAGTGSEATKNAVVSCISKRYKKSLRNDKMMARVALVDPELTYGLPERITARTGMDAVTQIIESYTSLRATPLTRAVCLDAAACASALLNAYERDDREARRKMCYLSLVSGIALANSGLGAAHGIAAGLGAVCGTHHGEACALLLPHVMKLNMAECGEDYAELGYKMTGVRSAEAAVNFIEMMNSRMGIPDRLGYIGISEERAEELSRASMGSSMSGNRVKMDTEACASFIRSII